MSKKKQVGNKSNLAQRADRHALYEMSVQDVETEADFIASTYRRLKGRQARHLREDFCGTAGMCAEWVRRDKRNHAIGVDIDAEVLGWGEQRHLAALKPQQRTRVSLLRQDVREVKVEPVDIVLAMNFSYQLFETRGGLRDYFTAVRAALAADGVFFLDAYGGYDAYREIVEETQHQDFTYIWEQASYNPIDGHMTCYIHFAFPDGSRLDRAFAYEWRLWTLPELQELLTEAGFSRVTVYWQGTDEETNEGNGIFTPATVGDADPGWIAYLTAEK